jgi:hypothetical protein
MKQHLCVVIPSATIIKIWHIDILSTFTIHINSGFKFRVAAKTENFQSHIHAPMMPLRKSKMSLMFLEGPGA